MSEFKLKPRPKKPAKPILNYRSPLYESEIKLQDLILSAQAFAAECNLDSIDDIILTLPSNYSDEYDCPELSINLTNKSNLMDSYYKELERYTTELNEFKQWQKDNKENIQKYTQLKKKEKLEREKAIRIKELEKQLKQLKGE